MKKFDQGLLDRNDNIARICCKYIAEKNGFKAIDNPDKFGADIIAEKNGDKYYFEGEIKINWTGKFTFPTVHIPDRKAKYLDEHANIMFVVISGDYASAMLVPGSAVRKSPLVEVNNIYNVDGEYFYDVPVDKCKLYKLIDMV